MSGWVQCRLCPKECMLAPGQRGDCRSRLNYKGKLVTLVYGKAVSANPRDPVEKKPVFHFLPGTRCFSVATAGCNLHCKNCQNYSISQLNPEDARQVADLPPEKLVREARRHECKSIAYTYSEPMTFFEYTRDSQKVAHEAGLKNILVTAAYINREPVKELARHADAANVDLKSMSDKFYQEVCDAHVDPVLRNLEILVKEGVWVEVTNLVIPTMNDSVDMIKRLCAWVVSRLGPDVPIHFSRFYPRYKLTGLPPTPADKLVQARDIARQEGVNYVYVGNMRVPQGGDTICPECGKTVIRRRGYSILEYKIEKGSCAYCGKKIPGVWR
ncbi:MAG: AmmeMemoRadiSam system radical SAM enzyme [bacterium]